MKDILAASGLLLTDEEAARIERIYSEAHPGENELDEPNGTSASVTETRQ